MAHLWVISRISCPTFSLLFDQTIPSSPRPKPFQTGPKGTQQHPIPKTPRNCSLQAGVAFIANCKTTVVPAALATVGGVIFHLCILLLLPVRVSFLQIMGQKFTTAPYKNHNKVSCLFCCCPRGLASQKGHPGGPCCCFSWYLQPLGIQVLLGSPCGYCPRQPTLTGRK